MKNDIEEAYCSFEVSKLLKEKGMLLTNQRLFEFYEKDGKKANSFKYLSITKQDYSKEDVYCSYPHALAIEWLRVNFGKYIYAFVSNKNSNIYHYYINVFPDSNALWIRIHTTTEFNSPQEAIEAALLYVLKELI